MWFMVLGMWLTSYKAISFVGSERVGRVELGISRGFRL